MLQASTDYVTFVEKKVLPAGGTALQLFGGGCDRKNMGHV